MLIFHNGHRWFWNAWRAPPPALHHIPLGSVNWSLSFSLAVMGVGLGGEVTAVLIKWRHWGERSGTCLWKTPPNMQIKMRKHCKQKLYASSLVCVSLYKKATYSINSYHWAAPRSLTTHMKLLYIKPHARQENTSHLLLTNWTKKKIGNTWSLKCNTTQSLGLVLQWQKSA